MYLRTPEIASATLPSIVDKVATGGYHDSMAGLKSVGIKELKNNLSAYLREVRRGTRILVSDRNTIVAELHEPRAGYGVPDSADPLVAEWTDSGIVSPPSRKKTPLPASPITSRDGEALSLLNQDRGDRER